MTPALRWTIVVAVEALLILLMLPFGFVFTTSLPIHQLQMVLSAAVGGIGWLAVLRRPSALPWPVVLAPLPLLGAMAITSIASAYPTLSWMATWQVAAYIGAFWLLALQASHPAGRRNLLGAIGIVVLLVLSSYILAVAMAWRSWLELGFPITSLPLRPANTGGLALIPTWFADVMVTTAPLLGAGLWRAGRGGVAIALVVIATGAVVLTGTRSVMLLLAGLVVVTLVFAIGRRRGGRTVAVAAAAAISIAAAGAAVLLASARSFDEGRFSAYASAVDRFLESPLLGGGPGTYGVRRMSDVVDLLGHLAFPDAHNIVLNTAAETGLVGLGGLLMTVALLGIAIRRTWRDAPAERPILAGALFGVAVLAGHGMVDVIFGLIGISVLAIAVIAIATTNSGSPTPTRTDVRRFIYPSLAAAVAVVVLSTVGVLRTEATFIALEEADRSLVASPAVALAIARRATEASPDSAPAWWVQMAAADASGDTAAAIDAARRMIELEGFGQQWMSLAILSARSGDSVTELEAIGHATAGPVDAFVELNAVILLDAAGDTPGAEASARRLLAIQPDIEQVLANGPRTLSALVARARPDVARDRLSAGDSGSAFVMALAGDDRPLADELLGIVATTDPTAMGSWTSIVNAWFGDTFARATFDAKSLQSPSLPNLLWSWLLAGRACDVAATELWEKAAMIAFAYEPTTPIKLGVAPEFQSWLLPRGYPSFIWRLDHPQRPYVMGAWTFALGRRACVAGEPAS